MPVPIAELVPFLTLTTRGTTQVLAHPVSGMGPRRQDEMQDPRTADYRSCW